MKKIILSILSLFIITAPLLGMQAPETAGVQVTFDKPHKIESEEEEITFMEINAYINNQKVGHVHYERCEPGVWYIKELKVNADQRNKSDKRVGLKLFSHILTRLCAKNPQRIYWIVATIETDGPSLEELNQIYMRMLSKITLPHSYRLVRDDHEFLSYMALEFNTWWRPL